MIVTTFVLPLFVFGIFKWLLSELFSLNLFMPPIKVMLPGMLKAEKSEKPALPQMQKIKEPEFTTLLEEQCEEAAENTVLVEKHDEEEAEVYDLSKEQDEGEMAEAPTLPEKEDA